MNYFDNSYQRTTKVADNKESIKLSHFKSTESNDTVKTADLVS